MENTKCPVDCPVPEGGDKINVHRRPKSADKNHFERSRDKNRKGGARRTMKKGFSSRIARPGARKGKHPACRRGRARTPQTEKKKKGWDACSDGEWAERKCWSITMPNGGGVWSFNQKERDADSRRKTKKKKKKKKKKKREGRSFSLQAVFSWKGEERSHGHS